MYNDYKICQFFYGYFSNIISDLQIPSISKSISNVTDITDPVLAVIDMLEDHPRMKNIRVKYFKTVISVSQKLMKYKFKKLLEA